VNVSGAITGSFAGGLFVLPLVGEHVGDAAFHFAIHSHSLGGPDSRLEFARLSIQDRVCCIFSVVGSNPALFLLGRKDFESIFRPALSCGE